MEPAVDRRIEVAESDHLVRLGRQGRVRVHGRILQRDDRTRTEDARRTVGSVYEIDHPVDGPRARIHENPPAPRRTLGGEPDLPREAKPVRHR